MKILDTPRSRKLGQAVAYQSRYGLCLRTHVIPKRTVTEARERMWGFMGYYSRAWSVKLTQAQRDRWIVAAGNVVSESRLGCGPLTGQQFFESVNLARACIGLVQPLWEPPPRPVFPANPVGELTIVNAAQGPRLLLTVTGSVTEDIMVFGQAPCSAGRSKRRNVAYLGLLPPPENGLSDITDLYVAKYGPLKPGTKIFIVTRQQKDGWEGPLKETREIVPAAPEDRQVVAKATLPLTPYMHTGCTQDAQEIAWPAASCSHEGSERPEPDGNVAKSALGGSGVTSEGAGPPG
jgi:hypothetical protein